MMAGWPNGARLPTHRQLADDLALSVQTVSRAYEELIRRGLISGEIGRGSFVQTQRREPEPPYLPERLGEVIDLSILKPVCEPMHLERLKQALAWLADNLPSSSALSFRPNVVFPRHRAVAVEWLKRCGARRLAAEHQPDQRRHGRHDRRADERRAARLDRRDRGDRPPYAGAAGHLSRLPPRRAADRRRRA